MWRISIFCYCYSIIKSYIFSWTFLITCKLNNFSCLYNLINYDVSKCSAEAEVESKVDLTNIFKKFSVDPPFVLVNYCCITTSPKTQWLKTNIYCSWRSTSKMVSSLTSLEPWCPWFSLSHQRLSHLPELLKVKLPREVELLPKQLRL